MVNRLKTGGTSQYSDWEAPSHAENGFQTVWPVTL